MDKSTESSGNITYLYDLDEEIAKSIIDKFNNLKFLSISHFKDVNGSEKYIAGLPDPNAPTNPKPFLTFYWLEKDIIEYEPGLLKLREYE